MSHLDQGIKNFFDGLGVFFQGLAVVVIMAISYLILLIKKTIKTIEA